MTTTTQRKRQSEKLTKDELKAFVKVYKSFQTKTDAEETLNISRQVLDLVALKGSGSPETIQKVRSIIAA